MPRPAVCAISALPADAVLAVGAAVVAIAITLDVVALVDTVFKAPHLCAGHISGHICIYISRSAKSCEGGKPPPEPYPPVLRSTSAAGDPPLLRCSHAYPPPPLTLCVARAAKTHLKGMRYVCTKDKFACIEYLVNIVFRSG